MTIFDELKAGLVSRSAIETEQIGARLASALPDNSVVALSGHLGTGKTTLVRGIARGLGIQADVTSPTYNIYSIYTGSRQLLHMDAYRLSDAHELDSLAIEEFLKPPFIMALEWPENVPGFTREYLTFTLSLDIRSDHHHEIRITDQNGP